MLARRLLRPEDVSNKFHLVSEGMEAAVELGTAQLAGTKAMRAAGKTGTSAGHAWFAGYAPADRPEIVVVIFLEQGGGGRDAAPIAGRVFAAHMPSKR
jgi:cell division protein FtsI/penicillin-binding protein 2